MQRIALFIDGASRATLIPFAPLLLGHLLNGHINSLVSSSSSSSSSSSLSSGDVITTSTSSQFETFPEALWSSITLATAGMIATYLIGRAVGTALGAHSTLVQYIFASTQSANVNANTNPVSTKAFSRTVGAIVALHFFSFGAGMEKAITLYFIRFFMGLCVGLLLRIVSGNHHNAKSLEVVVESGIAKVWLAGFAVSMLTSGVLYAPLSRSPVFILLTGGTESWEWIVATLFFLAVIFLTENLFQFCVGRFNVSDNDDDGYGDEMDFDHYDLELQSNKKEDKFNVNADMAVVRSSSLKKRNVSKDDDMASTPIRQRGSMGSENSAHWNDHSRQKNYNRRRLDSNSSHQGNRLRLDSNMSNRSNDIFFDCESRCDEQSVSWGLDEETGLGDAPVYESRNDSMSTACYENGKCVYEDGSPAPIQASLCVKDTPKSFFAIHKTKADMKWEQSIKWRMERRLWKIHAVQHRLFHEVKASYPHCVHGFTKTGYPVVYERPGRMTLKQKFAEGIITVDDMTYHYTHFMEYLSNVICQRPECRERLDNRPSDEQISHWGFFVVMDVAGLSLSSLSGDVLRYLQKAGVINADNYPHSTARALVVNSPFWLSSAFNSIKSILPKNTQADLLSTSNQLEGMRKYIDDDQIPKEFGGSSPYALGEHPFEKQLEELVESSKDIVNDDEEDIYFLGDGPSNSPNSNRNSPLTRVVSLGSCIEDSESFHVENRDNLEMSPLITSSLEEEAEVWKKNPSVETESFDRKSNYQNETELKVGYRWENAHHSEEYMFTMISLIHCVWCALQGSLETLLSVWLVSPQSLGGLGYEPRRSGFALCTAAIVLMWIQRSRLAKSLVRIPSKAPLRGYRIGVGAEVFFLLLLPFIPFISNFDNMLVLTTNVLLGVLMFIASIVGRLSSAKLHSIASSAYVQKVSLRCDTRTKLGQTLNMIATFVQKGGFTYILSVSGEITGSLIVAPIIMWSANSGHHFPLDTSFSFYTGAALCAVLYMLSFSFKVTGERTSNSFESAQEAFGHSSSSSIFTKVFAVTISDLASLFEESSWSPSSVRGSQGKESQRNRGQFFLGHARTG